MGSCVVCSALYLLLASGVSQEGYLLWGIFFQQILDWIFQRLLCKLSSFRVLWVFLIALKYIIRIFHNSSV